MENTSWSVESREALAAAAVSFAALVGFKGAAARRAERSGADRTNRPELAGGDGPELAGGDGPELAGAGLAGGGGLDRSWDDPMLDLVDDPWTAWSCWW